MSAHYNNTEIYKTICQAFSVRFTWDRLNENFKGRFPEHATYIKSSTVEAAYYDHFGTRAF
jgi:hypothetical protein